MKVFYLVPELRASGAELNFKSKLRPAALVSFTKRENFKNFAACEHCVDRKNFKIFASDEIEFTTHGEPKPATHSMVKFAARRGLKFEPCDAAARGFALRNKILNSRLHKNCTSFKISSRRGEKAK